ncbi:hypothetical protein Pelo_13588 [Pelomyxa schiedti]|nr:hypothetical protein Pelo_13588 [Pelomyxa schiedti]
MSAQEFAIALEALGFRYVEEKESDRCCLFVNPPCNDFFARCKIDDGDSTSCNEVEPFDDDLHPPGVIDLSTLPDGLPCHIEIISTKAEPELILHSFSVVKDSHRNLTVRTVDTGASVIESRFRFHDKDLEGAEVTADFTTVRGAHKYIIRGSTGNAGNAGKFSVMLPAGSLTKLAATQGAITVPKRGTITIPEVPWSLTPRKATSITIELDPTSFATMVCPAKRARVIILGDISGSMRNKGRMEILRQSFVDLLDRALSSDWRVCLAAWDSWVEWFGCGWIEPTQRAATVAWVQSLTARGGNDMRYAIEEALAQLPDATEVYVMCDGDISPFTLSPTGQAPAGRVPRLPKCDYESNQQPYNNTSWRLFRAQYPRTIFHFFALGPDSEAVHMQEMAEIGGGCFGESL